MNKQRSGIIAAILFSAVYFANSCANTTAPPSGGLKDTLAPVLLSVMPDSNTINFPAQKAKIELKFNEFIVLKEPEKNILLSPPQKKRVEAKVRGKSVIVEFPAKLDSATTYTLYFGNSIEDNNEGNKFPGYRYSFSTGEYIDSMLVTGLIVDAATLLPVPGALVAFYADHSDSALYKKLPASLARSDQWGFFLATNLKPVPYRLFAYTDKNSNNTYDPENEKVAFLDTLFTPGIVMKKGIEELKYTDLKDTSASLSRKHQLQMYIFREEGRRQLVRTYERPSERMVFVKFNAPEVSIDSLGFEGIDSSSVIKQFNVKHDSLVLWITEKTQKVPDSLFLNIKYYKTDSLNNLKLSRERLKFVAPRVKKTDQKSGNQQNAPRKDLLKVVIEAVPSLIEKDGYKLEFPAPLTFFDDKNILFTSRTPKGVEAKEEVSIFKDSSEMRIYHLKPKGKMYLGYDYMLTIPKGAFRDIYGNTNDTLVSTINLPKNERLSRIDLKVTGADGSSYVIELISQTREKVFRSYKILYDATLDFPYLEPGRYSIRIFRDVNGNGILDSGNIQERKQPEKVRLFTLPSGSNILELKEGMELEQKIDLKEIFK